MSTQEVLKEDNLIDLSRNILDIEIEIKDGNKDENKNEDKNEDKFLVINNEVEETNETKEVTKFNEILSKQNELISKIEELNLKLSNINDVKNINDNINNNMGEIVFEVISPIDGTNKKEVLKFKDEVELDKSMENIKENIIKHCATASKSITPINKMIDNSQCPFFSYLFESDYEIDSLEYILEYILKHLILIMFFIIFVKFISKIFIL